MGAPPAPAPPARRPPPAPRALFLMGGGPRLDPAVGQPPVAHELLEGVDGDGAVVSAPVAGRFARMRTDAPHHRGQRVLLPDQLPGAPVVPGPRLGDPGRHGLARGTGRPAGGRLLRVPGTAGPPAAGLDLERRALRPDQRARRAEVAGHVSLPGPRRQRSADTPPAPPPRF